MYLDKPHNYEGGTYPIGGEPTATFNITYNYTKIYQTVLEGGLSSLDGKTAKESLRLLTNAITAIPYEEPSDDYWACTNGNARIALVVLFTLATKVPEDSVWRID